MSMAQTVESLTRWASGLARRARRTGGGPGLVVWDEVERMPWSSEGLPMDRQSCDCLTADPARH